MKLLFTIAALALCTTSFAQLVNGGMESWRTYTSGSSSSLTAPVGWSGIDSVVYYDGPTLCSTCNLMPQTFQSANSHSGMYAAEIMTRYYGGGLGFAAGQLTNATLSFNTATEKLEVSGGIPVTQRIDSMTVWVEFFPKDGDSGSVSVHAILAGMGAGGTDSIVGAGLDSTTLGSHENYILSTGTYTKHTYIMSYRNSTVIPDHIQIYFNASYKTGHDSTTMYVDDVSIYPSSATGVSLLGNNTATVCYPNPAGNMVHIQTNQYQNTVAELYNQLGQRVAIQSLQSSLTDMDISSLSSGIYLLHLRDKNNTIIYQVKIVKQE